MKRVTRLFVVLLAILSLVAIPASATNSMAAVTPAGSVVGWGDNGDIVPVPEGLSGVVAIAAGGYTAMALKSDGTVVDWGYSYIGMPTQPAGLTEVVAIAAGEYFDLALKSDGTVVAWRGHPYWGPPPLPEGLSGIIAIAAHGYRALALKTDGTVIRIGKSTSNSESIPGAVAIATGYSHDLVLKSDGTVVGGGDNTYGQATPPAGLNSVVAIAAGYDQNLALKADGTVVAWGRHDYLGSTPPEGLSGVVAIASGYGYNLALKRDSTPPVANDDSYATDEDTALSVPAPGVLGNDSTSDPGTFAATLMSSPVHGAVDLQTDGSFVYMPPTNFYGTDSFTYQANDGLANSNVAAVTIIVAAVNDAPTANDDTYSTTAGTTLSVAAPGLLANDSDLDSTTLSASKLTNPVHGTLTLNADGSFVYQPAAGYAGEDSFTYRISDDTASSNVATVRLTVTKVFPQSSVLDTFNRANGKVGSNWEGLTSTDFYKIASNKLDVQLGGPLVWRPSSFGTTQEAFVTLRTIDTRSLSQGVLLKVQTGSSLPNAGAISVVYDAVAKAVRISALRLERNGAWTLYANQGATFANGDVLGACAKADGTITIYKNGVQIASATLNTADQAFFNAKGGKIGIWTVAASSAVMDDFGGGNVGP